MKKAFTMVELIFVIVIIGILASVAMPRLAASRDDASAATCTQEAQQLISEITQSYVVEGYNAFSVLPVEEITNIRIGVVEDNGISSLEGRLIPEGVKYLCNGVDIVEVKGFLSGIDYNLTVTDLNPSEPPAAVIASENIRKLNNIDTAGGSRVYRLH